MKNFPILALALFCAVSFVSCNKEDPDPFAASYTYKTSGTVTLIPSDINDMTDEQKAELKELGIEFEPKVYILEVEQGQMHIIKEGDDGYFITFNDIFGNVSTAKGQASGGVLTIGTPEGSAKKIVKVGQSAITVGGGEVSFTGTGRIVDFARVFDMKYTGTVSVAGVEMLITDSSVTCVANVN